MNEPADGATTMKKKAAEKLAAKAAPAPVEAEVVAVVETPADVEAVVENPETPVAEAEATPEAAAE